MISRSKISLVLLFCCVAFRLSGQTAGYKFKRPISGINTTWHSLQLPDQLFVHIRPGFEDLRIFGIQGKDTLEVPYLLKQRIDRINRIEVPFTQINQSVVENRYYFSFQSTQASVINQIKLDFKQNNFDWKVLLEGSDDNKIWFTILKDYRILSISNNNTDYEFSTLNFPDSKYQYFRISINSQFKPDLDLAKIARTDTIKGLYKTVKPKSILIKNSQETKESTVDLTLNNLSPVSSIKLNVKNNFDFYRNFRIEYATDSFQTDKGMQYNYADLYKGTLTSFEKTEFSFTNTIVNRLRIVIENDDNAPLQFGAIELKGNVFEVIARFNEPNRNYAFYYGNDKTAAPNYEISKFEDKIPSTLNTATIGNEENNPSHQFKTDVPLINNKIWLWALIAVIIIVIGGFSYKMLKN